MKIIVIGASGVVGKAICNALGSQHDIITMGRTSGDFTVDIDDRSSIEAMYRSVGKVDAVICAAGSVHYGPVDKMTENEFLLGVKSKLMGQVNLVQAGIEWLSDGGVFTLTSGITNRDPIRDGSGSAAVNAALDGYVIGAAIEMPRGIRINAVSPGVLQDSLDVFGQWFPGHEPVSSERVGLAYQKSVEGLLTGQVITV